MPWRKVIPILLLFALAALLAGVNTWFTAARSTIPLVLDTKVLSKEVRREKHEGKDDVCLLELKGLGQMQVDRQIYESVAVGETLQKDRHSRKLRHADQVSQLGWSRDHQGMLMTMPMCLGILAATLVSAVTLSFSPWNR